jgi:hypothetical protein
VIDRSGGCRQCGGETFHRLGCPLVKWTLILTMLMFGVIVAVFILVRGLDDGIPGPVILFALYLALCVIWLLASRGKSPLDP